MDIQMGDRFTLSALQLVLLCDRAVEEFVERLQDYQETVDKGGFKSPPDEMETARDTVVAYLKENFGEKAEKADKPEPEYNAEHAKEWLERHPHGWYNNENDYGTGDEGDGNGGEEA